MLNESFEKYFSNLKMEDKFIWKPVNNKRKPKAIRKYPKPPRQRAKSDKEKVEIFAENVSEIFSAHNNDQWNKP